MGCILVVFLYNTFFSEGYEIVKAPPQNVEIIAFGDSLVYGIGSEQGGGFVPVLSELIDVSILNAGVSGNTTVQGLKRLDKDVMDYNPGVVLVLLGGVIIYKRFQKMKLLMIWKRLLREFRKTML